MEPGMPTDDADAAAQIDDSEDGSEDEPELVDLEDAPNVEPIEVADHSEGDRAPD